MTLSGTRCARLSASALGLTVALAACGTAGQRPPGGSAAVPATRHAPVTLPDAHTFVLPDPGGGDGYRIYVALPRGYDGGSRRYPVLYLLDGDSGFALATQAYRLLRVDEAMPDLLIVGIGYEGAGGERRARRILDLTPTRTASDSASATGGSAAFLSFVAEALVPTIDSLYRTDPGDRAIMGHSLGGLFALYALFERPDVFRRYIASSPSLWWDEGVVFRYESLFARGRTSLPKSVFMSVGAEEAADMREPFRPFADSVRARRYPDLAFTAVVLPGETHLTAFATSFQRGLRTVYP